MPQRMRCMEIVNAYPTPIGIFEFEDSEYLNQGLVEFLYDIRDNEKSEMRSMTGNKGFHTPDDLLKRDNPYIKEFHGRISEVLIEYFPRITTERIGEHTRMTSWGMIYGTDSYSRYHMHPGADLSSVYYCKVPKDMKIGEGVFEYHDPRPASLFDRNFMPSAELIKPIEGSGVIFPGWLPHSTAPHTSKEDRICIATNIFIDHGTFFK